MWQSKQEHAVSGNMRRPWITVDVRDVAEAHIRIFERLGGLVSSGDRYLLTDMTRIHPEDIGKRINDLFPEYKAADMIGLDDQGGTTTKPIDPVWDRVQARNDLSRARLGADLYTPFEVTLRETVESLVTLGGVVPVRR